MYIIILSCTKILLKLSIKWLQEIVLKTTIVLHVIYRERSEVTTNYVHYCWIFFPQDSCFTRYIKVLFSVTELLVWLPFSLLNKEQEWSHSCRWYFSLLELTILVVIGTDCTGSCKSNYHMISTMTAPTPDIKWTIPDSR